ncbi:MAG: RNA 3'-phosphate cyclase [Anaerolineae bacterium]|nr:RNA 3'-phosphate cyclase [Anaerolineae bacterium]
MTDIILDGSQGEGGGQIVRTALALSAITGQPFVIDHIRAGRKPAGLRPQHVTAIHAAADICAATVKGAEVGADRLIFTPGEQVMAGEYEWVVGTAGSAPLVIQTVLLPLALANGASTMRVHGGTHVPGSPSGHYLRDVYMPLLLGLGADVEIYLETLGWVPQGGGAISVQTGGGARLRPAQLVERGLIERVFGIAVGCNLPSHIPQRIANRAVNLLESVEVPVDIRPCRTRSISTGAGLFLAVEYGNGRGGFGMIGQKGMPSEEVAEKAVTALLDFHDSGAPVDRYAADQLVIPLALAEGASAFTAQAITSHLRTNIAVVRQFVHRAIEIDEQARTVRFAPVSGKW